MSLHSVAWLLPYLLAAVASALLTCVLVMIAPAKGWVVVPRQNRWNTRVVAQFGGVPVLLVFLTAGLLLSHDRQSVLLMLLTLGMGILGLVDDVVGLGPKPKLIVEVLLAALAVYAGVLLPLTGFPLLDQFLTLLWIVGITNAFNLIDNMDGLAAGVGLITVASIVAFSGFNSPVGVPVLSLLAALAGFYAFNACPARIFMGDAGALPIGFFLACCSAFIVPHTSTLNSLILPGLLLFIPIFDVLLVIFTRPLNDRTIYDGARDHTSHRLVFLGLSERQAVVLLYGIAAAAGGLVVVWNHLSPEWKAGLSGVFLAGALLFWIYLARLDLPVDWLSQRKSSRAMIGQAHGTAQPLVDESHFSPAQVVSEEFD